MGSVIPSKLTQIRLITANIVLGHRVFRSEERAGCGGKERKEEGGWMYGMRMNHHLLPKSGISCGVASVGNINGFLAEAEEGWRGMGWG